MVTTAATSRPSAEGLLRAELVDPSEWASIADWDEVVASMSRPSVFLTRAWVSAWWEQVGRRDRTPLLVRVADPADRTVGLVPFTMQHDGLTGRRRRLGLFGDALVGSEYLGPAAREGDESAVAEMAVETLETAQLQWDTVSLRGLRSDDPASRALIAVLVRGGGRHDLERHPCAAIALPADAHEWMAGLGSSFRRRVRQRRRRLERDHRVVARLASSTEDVAVGLDRLFQMHQQRWTAQGRPGSFADPRMTAFYRQLAPAFLDAGWLRLWLLEVDGVIRAVQFGFAFGETLHSLQEAFDSEWAPAGVGGLGVVLRAQAIEAAIEEGLNRYDFLGGNQDHKQRWGTTEHEVQRLRLARPGSGLAWQTTFGAEDLRDRLAAHVPEQTKLAARRVLRARSIT